MDSIDSGVGVTDEQTQLSRAGTMAGVGGLAAASAVPPPSSALAVRPSSALAVRPSSAPAVRLPTPLVLRPSYAPAVPPPTVPRAASWRRLGRGLGKVIPPLAVAGLVEENVSNLVGGDTGERLEEYNKSLDDMSVMGRMGSAVLNPMTAISGLSQRVQERLLGTDPSGRLARAKQQEQDDFAEESRRSGEEGRRLALNEPEVRKAVRATPEEIAKEKELLQFKYTDSAAGVPPSQSEPTDEEQAMFLNLTGTPFDPNSIADKLNLDRMRAGQSTLNSKQNRRYRQSNPDYRPGQYSQG